MGRVLNLNHSRILLALIKSGVTKPNRQQITTRVKLTASYCSKREISTTATNKLNNVSAITQTRSTKHVWETCSGVDSTRSNKTAAFHFISFYFISSHNNIKAKPRQAVWTCHHKTGNISHCFHFPTPIINIFQQLPLPFLAILESIKFGNVCRPVPEGTFSSLPLSLSFH